MKTITIIIFCAVILLLWGVANAMSKPIFNKMSKNFEFDTLGNTIANYFIFIIIIMSFLIGVWI
jgi:NADH:ubiquinone oxidoreductase subunit 6 (subunit J)